MPNKHTPCFIIGGTTRIDNRIYTLYLGIHSQVYKAFILSDIHGVVYSGSKKYINSQWRKLTKPQT